MEKGIMTRFAAMGMAGAIIATISFFRDPRYKRPVMAINRVCAP